VEIAKVGSLFVQRGKLFQEFSDLLKKRMGGALAASTPQEARNVQYLAIYSKARSGWRQP
jgi:hypothetical protein